MQRDRDFRIAQEEKRKKTNKIQKPKKTAVENERLWRAKDPRVGWIEFRDEHAEEYEDYD